MKTLSILLLLIFLTIIETRAQTAQDFARIWEKDHISKMPPSQVRHRDLQNYLNQLKTLGLKVEEVGRSYQNREIYEVEWGHGATKVFMWSQMHGDEPTATSAVIDLLAFLQTNENIAWVKDLENKITLRVVPMLNPDGEENYTRRNAQGIDINRDAMNLATPEGRLLKKLRDEWQPEIGFNLHNQNELTTVDHTKKQATISLLAVSGSPTKESNAGHQRNRRLCSLMIAALDEFIPGHIARYDDDYNPRAFGDRISEWGTPVILIETGALDGKDEMFLTKMNFIAFLVALRALATGSEAQASPEIYDKLPFNATGDLFDFIFRRANIINYQLSKEPFIADVSVNTARRRAGEPTPTSVQDIGDLSIYAGLDEYNASDFYLAPRGKENLRVGASGDFLLYKKTRKIDWTAQDLEKTFPPDAIFSQGKWTKGAGIMPKINQEK
ncbi:MAG: M14 family zinc carboxypeptidase [Pyrinomonadaceae bacterium]